jgi:spermidine synthase
MARQPIEHAPVTLSEHDGVRYLHLGTVWIQGGMRMASRRWWRSTTCSACWPACCGCRRRTWAGQAVQLGLGAGAITRFTVVQLKMATTVVEINPQVVAVNAAGFHLPARAEVVQGDAADWLDQARTGQRAAAARGPVRPRSRRAGAGRRGLLPRLPGSARSGWCDERQPVRPPRQLPASIARIAAAFGSHQVWSLRPTREGNTVVVAGPRRGGAAREELAARAATIEQRFGPLGLPARKWLRMVRPYNPHPARPTVSLT